MMTPPALMDLSLTPMISLMMSGPSMLELLSRATPVTLRTRAARMMCLMSSIPMNQVESEARVLETAMPEFVHNYDNFGLALAQLGLFSRWEFDDRFPALKFMYYRLNYDLWRAWSLRLNIGWISLCFMNTSVRKCILWKTWDKQNDAKVGIKNENEN